MSKNILSRLKDLEKTHKARNQQNIFVIEHEDIFEVGTNDGHYTFHSSNEYEAFKKTKPDAEICHIRIVDAE